MNDITRATTTALLLQQLPNLLNAISAASQLAGAGPAVPRYLSMAAALIGHGTTAYHELVALKDLVAVMVREDREPTPEEWEAMEVRGELAHNRIQDYDVDSEAERGDVEEEPKQAV